MKENLFKKEWHIVEKGKYYFLISGFIIVLGLILLFIPKIGFNLGIDFEGGYSVEISYSSGDLTRNNYESRLNEIEKIVESVKNSKGENLKISRAQLQGTDENASILIRFKAIDTDEIMEDDILPDLKSALEEGLADPSNPYSVEVENSGRITATVSQELFISGISAIILALALMLLYIAFRFEMASGISAIIGLLHDSLFMIVFMVFTRIEVNSTFIAALITIFGYSINNTIVIFDRIREKHNAAKGADKTGKDEQKILTPKQQANEAIRDTFWRTFNTAVTAIGVIVLLSIFGVDAIREFSIPILFGLIVGNYSALCITPSIWAMWGSRKKKDKNKKLEIKDAVTEDNTAASQNN